MQSIQSPFEQIGVGSRSLNGHNPKCDDTCTAGTQQDLTMYVHTLYKIQKLIYGPRGYSQGGFLFGSPSQTLPAKHAWAEIVSLNLLICLFRIDQVILTVRFMPFLSNHRLMSPKSILRKMGEC